MGTTLREALLNAVRITALGGGSPRATAGDINPTGSHAPGVLREGGAEPVGMVNTNVCNACLRPKAPRQSGDSRRTQKRCAQGSGWAGDFTTHS